MALIPTVSTVTPNDWNSVVTFSRDTQRAFQKLGSFLLGPASTPTFAGITFTGLTASRLVSTNASTALTSVSDLTAWVAGTANEISVASDGDGTVTIGLVDPLLVSKGGTGAATLTDHGILLGSGTDAVTPLGAATHGQLPIGSTGADPVLATLTAGSGVSIANAAGSITIAASAGGIDHNSLSGLQGGTTNEYYHLTSADYTELTGWLDNVTLVSNGVTDWTITNTVAAGEQGLNLSLVQGTNALTGTLRGVYSVVTNGNFASTGTIRAIEGKARAALSDLTGGNVGTLEGMSLSADAKNKTITTLRGAEIILDGQSGAAITTATGLRISNNFQAAVATTSYGLHIYRDSFDYTADILLSKGGLITGDSYLNQDCQTTGSPTFAGLTTTGDVQIQRTGVSGQYLDITNDISGCHLNLTTTSAKGLVLNSGTANSLSLQTAGTTAIHITTAQRVGMGGITIPNEVLEVGGKIRANTAFNLNGTDGSSNSGAGVPTAITISGGIVTSITKNDWLDQSVKVASTPTFTGLQIGSTGETPTVWIAVNESGRGALKLTNGLFSGFYGGETYPRFTFSRDMGGSGLAGIGLGDGGTAADSLFYRIGTGVIKVDNELRSATVRANTVFNLNGTNGVTAGPYTTITSITVTGGIITAISGS